MSVATSATNMATFWLLAVLAVFSTASATKYKDSDKVMVYVNKVGPYFNPHETYHYYQLPVCRPDQIEHKSLTLGEVLDGDRMAMSLYDIKFKDNIENQELCKVKLSDTDLTTLRDAIEDLYYFEFVLDDIPVRGFIGHLEEGGFLPHNHKVYLWAHLHFNIEYNEDQIIYANVSTKDRSPVSLEGQTGPMEVSFTYSVKWHLTDTKYSERSKRMRDSSFFPKTLEIHWLSIINSMVLVFLLIGFVVIIMTRVLKNDFARYNLDEEEEVMDEEDNGWKIIHTDVFRYPPFKSLFCAILGVGSQFLAIGTGILLMAVGGLFNVHHHWTLNSTAVVLYAGTSCDHGIVNVFACSQHTLNRVFTSVLWLANLDNSVHCGVGTQFLCIASGILLMAILGMFNVHHHGAINTAAILLYALTSCISGYVATNMYRKMGGDNWVWNVNLTSALFALPFFLVWAFVNSVAWGYGSTQALPWGTVLLLGLLWGFLGYPLTVIGGIFGKNWANGFDAPCRTKNIAREIPLIPWYRSALAHCVVGGFLPFSAISVELYYIFATLWGREQYTLYGILFVVYGILLSVTACISVALTYFQLSAEDYRWWWRSIFSAGSTGVFVFLYSLFYYFKRSNMSGMLQTVEFFGYTVLTCYVFFLMLGTVAFFASLKFIRYIYINIKMD